MKQASFILYFAPDRRPIHRRLSLPLPLPPTHPLSYDRKESKHEGKNSVLGYNGNLVDFHWTITVFSRGKEGNGKFHLCWFVSHFTAENRFGSFVRYDGADFMSGAWLWQWFGLIWVRDPETAPCQSVLITPVFLHSYPSVVVVPQSISDDSILRIAKNHRQGRFPVAVWRHQRNKATLLRAGGIERSTIGSIMRQTKNVGQGGVASHAISSSASAEQEKYFSAVGE